MGGWGNITLIVYVCKITIWCTVALQEKLERCHREAVCLAQEEKLAKKQLVKELDKLQQTHSKQGREKEEVKTQLALQTESKQRLAVEVIWLPPATMVSL